MQIEKLNENKIKITLNLEDLQEKNIDLHSFMSNSIESQDLFYDMLDKAEKEIGFKTKNHKLIIEALAIPDGKFILTITRLAPEEDKKKIKVKRKNIDLKNNLTIYSFNTFDEYLELCNYIFQSFDNTLTNKLKHSSLYQYNSKYYLCLKLNSANLSDLKSIHCSIIEFGSHISNSDLFERKLVEYGKIILKTNAINCSIKAFLQ